jgi:hypothetical protein
VNAAEIRDMNERIRLRREEVAAGDDFLAVPVRGPSWCEKVFDTGRELLAIHRDTAEPYPIDLRRDLSSEDAAVVLIRRIFHAGGSRAEAERFIDAFGLDAHVVRRLVRELAEMAS